MATDPRPEALRAPADTGLRLARPTTSARLALARPARRGRSRDAAAPAARARRREMERAHAEATTALAFTEIEKALKDAWVAPPTPSWTRSSPSRSPAPRPSRCTAAFHDGAAVAVKVLRPGIADQVRQDLAQQHPRREGGKAARAGG